MDIPNFLAPTPSRGSPPPHPKISGPKSLGLASFSSLKSTALGVGFFFSESVRPAQGPKLPPKHQEKRDSESANTFGKIEWGIFGRGGVSNNRFVLKPDIAIASEVSILSKNSLAITDFNAKKTQHVQLFETPLPGTPPSRFPTLAWIWCPQLAGTKPLKALRGYQASIEALKGSNRGSKVF